ncbi:Probable pectinesterase 68 [Linum perenne]
MAYLHHIHQISSSPTLQTFTNFHLSRDRKFGILRSMASLNYYPFILFILCCFFSLNSAVSLTTAFSPVSAPAPAPARRGGGHHWVAPVGHRVITVDVNGSGQFRSVQAAIDSVPENNDENVVVRLSPGVYVEKVVVPATKPYITLEGTAGRHSTVVEWHDRAKDPAPNGEQLRTYRTASVTVFANYFTARNISFKDCELHSIAKRFGSIAAQDRKSPDEKTGFAFLNCKVTGTGQLYVGRAMGQYSRIVYSHTYFDDVVAHGGWDDWDHVSNKNKTAYFGVYKCFGPGAEKVRGVSWARELDFDSAHKFLAKSFVNGRHWLPLDALLS